MNIDVRTLASKDGAIQKCACVVHVVEGRVRSATRIDHSYPYPGAQHGIRRLFSSFRLSGPVAATERQTEKSQGLRERTRKPSIEITGMTESAMNKENPDWFQAARENDVERMKTLLIADPNLLESRQGYALQSALHCAASREAYEALDFLLNRGADPNIRGFSGETPLHLITELPFAERLLAAGADPAAPDSSGVTPMDFAFEDRNRELYFCLAAHHPGGSPNHHFIQACRRRQSSVEGMYHRQFRNFAATRLGIKDGHEVCVAWQYTGSYDLPQRGWITYQVDELKSLYWGDPLDEYAGYDPANLPEELNEAVG